MASIAIVRTEMGDGSPVYDLLIQGDGESVRLPVMDGVNEKELNNRVSRLHDALEAALGETVSWLATLGGK
jgi:hypothetical protein